MQDYDVFSRCHPAVNFLFFAAAIVLTVVLFHPAYLLVSLLCGGAYYAVLRRARCAKTLGFLLIAMVLVAAVNPLFNTLGETILFTLFGRPYTWQALCYGGCAGMMFAAVSLWFLCGGIVMTSDKFTSLFGAVIPAISLVLVMVLRLIPAYWRMGKQIAGARKCIGRSGAGSRKEISRAAWMCLCPCPAGPWRAASSPPTPCAAGAMEPRASAPAFRFTALPGETGLSPG